MEVGKGRSHLARGGRRPGEDRAGGIGYLDGVIKYWFDGELVIDHEDVVFRTGQHPDMKIDQFMMAPYYGPGVPHPQTIWVDDIRITTDER